MHNVLLSLGSNLGNRQVYLSKAIRLLRLHAGEIKNQSSVYETEPWGFTHENNFYNQCIAVLTPLNPFSLLQKIHEIEKTFGRGEPTLQYEARTIDIDILFYDDLVLESSSLSIPHPRMEQRLFVLEPLAEIAPGFIHPVRRLTVLKLLEQCTDDKAVTKIN